MDPILKARRVAAQHWNDVMVRRGVEGAVREDDFVVVWFCYILGGWKSLVFNNANNFYYYEITYNREKGETYADLYSKIDNKAYPD